jgi:hemerythrin-like metal-binding protein
MNKPEYIKWSEQFSIGNENVDNDHKKLFEIHNDLVDLALGKCSRDEFARILSMMTDYVLKHFKKEEAYMNAFSYPDYERHRKLHEEYSYKVAMYNFELSGSNPPDPFEIILFIKKWWTNHVIKVDRKYEDYKTRVSSTAGYSSF